MGALIESVLTLHREFLQSQIFGIHHHDLRDLILLTYRDWQNQLKNSKNMQNISKSIVKDANQLE